MHGVGHAALTAGRSAMRRLRAREAVLTRHQGVGTAGVGGMRRRLWGEEEPGEGDEEEKQVEGDDKESGKKIGKGVEEKGK